MSKSSLTVLRPADNASLPGVPRPLRAIRLRCLDCSETLADVRNCPCSSCHLWRFRMGKRPRAHVPAPDCPATSENLTAEALGACSGPKATRNTKSPLRAIRKHCLDCAGCSAKYVTWCSHSGRCPLWPYRLGVRPATAYAKFPALLTPELMPSDAVCLDDLPASTKAAVSWLLRNQTVAPSEGRHRVQAALLSSELVPAGSEVGGP